MLVAKAANFEGTFSVRRRLGSRKWPEAFDFNEGELFSHTKEFTVTATTPATRGPRQESRTVVDNRQARYLFSIEDTFTAGLMLEGWEVKAILAGQATFNGGGAFVRLKNGEAFLDSLTITPLLQARKGLLDELNPLRPRKLLLNRSEINKIQRRVAERGYTVVPLALTYNGKFKLEIGVAKGKKQADKRETVKERDGGRELAREVKDLRM